MYLLSVKLDLDLFCQRYSGPEGGSNAAEAVQSLLKTPQ